VPIATAVPAAPIGPDWTGFYGGAQLGWGDVEMATLVAAHSGEPAENVVRLWKLRGRAWQAVGDELGIADVEALKAEVREED